MSSLFQNKRLFNGDISKWDVFSVTTMSRIFDGATAFISDLSKWGVSRVTDMNLMFHDVTLCKHKICGMA